jgi:flagellar biosynthesis protein FlhB
VLTACGLAALFLAPALWLEPAALLPLLARYLGYTAAALGLVALIDVASARAALFRALWLTRREQAQELREAYGAPELRRARELARHATREGRRHE